MRTMLMALMVVLVAGAGAAPEPGSIEADPADGGPEPIRALIIDGVNNHDWENTTIATKATLESTGRFVVEVSTSPDRRASREEWEAWRPDLFANDVVISNFNEDCEQEGGCEPLWSADLMADFERYVREGGGYVPIHAADNHGADWPEYNEIIAVGGWGNRSAGKSGYLLRLIDGEWVPSSPNEGLSGEHGRQREFEVIHDQPDHPIVAGLPPVWMHAMDELYSALRGPAQNVEVLAHSFSLLTEENEPMLMLITYGEGKIFHIPMGHYNDEYEPHGGPVYCVGYQTVLARGAEYVATGEVTLGIPEGFPTAERSSSILPEELVW